MPERRFTPGAVSYSGRMSSGYATGRALHPVAAETWRAAIVRWFASVSPQVVADIGAGTGRFSALIAETLGARVLAVEPSAEMRARAQVNERVAQIAGDGLALPLRDASCDGAWMGYVAHHIPDLAVAAGEVARVVRPGGRLVVAGGFPDLLGDITLFCFFPEARRIVEAFPTSKRVISSFTGARLGFEAAEPVTLRTADSLAEASARTRLRADTTLDLLTDEEFARGQAAIEASADAESANPQPIDDTIHALLFERR